MRIDILTLFPEMFAPLFNSVIGRAVKSGKVEIVVTDIRDHTEDKHRKCDDYPYGGGAGMVMMPQPVYSAINAVDPERKARRIFMSPKGRTFNQSMIKELLSYDRLLFLCGHYEGVDQRALDMCIDEEISLGDFVLTGGEIPAMAITDSILRYVDGVIAGDSLAEESFTGNLLEYPQYTRPRNFLGSEVPEILLAGNHKEVAKWREEQALKLTEKNRPDMALKFASEHEMRLSARAFDLIKSGKKTVELRLFDEKRKKINVGDKIIFTEENSGEKISVTVKNLYVSGSFKDLYRCFDKSELGYAENEPAKSEDMDEYYSKREQKKYGAFAIVFKKGDE